MDQPEARAKVTRPIARAERRALWLPIWSAGKAASNTRPLQYVTAKARQAARRAPGRSSRRGARRERDGAAVSAVVAGRSESGTDANATSTSPTTPMPPIARGAGTRSNPVGTDRREGSPMKYQAPRSPRPAKAPII